MDISAAGIPSVTGAAIGTSFWERNGKWAGNRRNKKSFSCGLSLASGPTLVPSFGLKKVKQTSILVKAELSNKSGGCELLEKEFDFKPSFEESLKAMESFKTRREKKQMTSYRKTSGSNKLGDFEGHADGQMDRKESGKREREDMNKMEVDEKRDRGSACNLILGKLESKQNTSGLSTSTRLDKCDKYMRREENHGNTTQEVELKGKEREIVKFSRRFVGGQGNGEAKGHSFKVDKGSVKGTKMVTGQVGSFIHTETVPNEKISVENVRLKRSNMLIEENSDDEELQFERAAFRSLEEIKDVVDKPRITRNEMEERIQKLARCLNGADVNMPEWMFSKMMRSAKIRFSDHSILRIIQVLGKLENWRRVLQLIEWLQLRERFKSHKLRYIYTTALGVLGKARRPVEALNLFHIMQQHMSTYPDLVAYHCIAVTLGQAGHMRELFDVIDIMKSPPKKKFKYEVIEKWDPRLEPDIVVYNAVLNACVRRKQWEGAFWVLQQLNGKGQQPSGTTYGLVMEVMLACGKYNLVHDFFKKVLKSSVPNALTYKVLVNTLWREGKVDEAVLTVEDMERRGIVGSAALYYDLARCLCSAGRCQEALVQVDKICRVANKPLVVTFTGLMQACLDAGNIEDGAYIFKHMHKFCSPNLVTCNIMLKAYLEHGKFEEANSLFQKLLKDGNHVTSKSDYKDKVIPDIYSFNTMLDACVAEQRWDEFEVIYNGMLEYGYHFNAKRHLRMILEACRAGKGELLEKTWNHLIQMGQTPPPLPLMKEMFCMRLEQGDHVAALSCISSHHHSDVRVFSHNAWLNFFQENAHRLQKDSLLTLVHEVSLLMSKGEAQDLIHQNLVLACREFLRTRMCVLEMDRVGTLNVLC